MMKRFKLDPKNPPEMTPAQLKRLDEMPIDYSDIPELDDEFFKNAKVVNWPAAQPKPRGRKKTTSSRS
jgi:hypothetical protein